MLFFVQKPQVLGGGWGGKGATERSNKKTIMSRFFSPPADFRGAQGSNSGGKSSSSGTIACLKDHVKLLRRELHLTVADLMMICHLSGRSRYQHLIHNITSHCLERAVSYSSS